MTSKALFALFVLVTPLLAVAQDLSDKTVDGSIRTAAGVVSFRTTQGFLPVSERNLSALVSYTSYTALGGTRPGTRRPLLFAVNGGPGASSMWLQMGMLGPKKLDLGANGIQPPQPARLVENENFPIDATDIVIMDAVGAGFSRPAPGVPPNAFYNTMDDAAILTEFVAAYIRAQHREGSPIFLVGESYGGTRVSLMAEQLQALHQLPVAGLLMISPAFGFADYSSGPGTTGLFWQIFPSFATAAWFHRKVAPEYQAMSEEQLFAVAQDFAVKRLRPYLEARGLRGPAEREQLLADAVKLTGLSRSLLDQKDLRITNDDFATNVLGNPQDGVSVHDARATNSLAQVAGKLFYVAEMTYLGGDLGLNRGLPFLPAARIDQWGVPVNVLGNLARALRANLSMRVLVLNGIYDLVCPLLAVRAEMDGLPADVKASGRLRFSTYPTGHMVYMTDAGGRLRLGSEIRSLVSGR